jgi:hypothetical protein
MNRDIINLIHNQTLASYRAEMENMYGYVENTPCTIIENHPMLSIVQASESYIGPFMFFEGDVYIRWWRKMMPLFHKFLNELSEEYYIQVKTDIERRYTVKP